jgi:large repetitive protein
MTMQGSRLLPLGLFVALGLTIQLPTARAVITTTGDIYPATAPSTWTDSTDSFIGKDSSGTLRVDGDSDLLSRIGNIGYKSNSQGTVTVDGAGSTWTSNSIYVGYYGSGSFSITNGGNVIDSGSAIGEFSGSTGGATVDGAGSTWTNTSDLLVGVEGNGTLSILNGSSVSANGTTQIGIYAGSTGAILFGACGGTLTTGSLLASPSQLSGTGTIITHGLVSDVDLIFDSNHGLKQTIRLQHTDQDITINLDISENSGSYPTLGAGWRGDGSLTIQDAIKVTSVYGYIGYGSGSTGVATVTGTGSTWNVNSLNVGGSGSGTLAITNGGSVSVGGETYVGRATGSTGIIDFGMNGGTLTTRTLLASPAQLTGTGVINTHGLISDIDLVFDSTHNLTQTLSFQQSGQNVTVNLDMASSASSLAAFGAGWKDTGSLTIQDAIKVTCAYGYLGYGIGSTGTAVVMGTNSSWVCNGGVLYVGYYGTGTLLIANCGSISDYSGHIGEWSNSTGAVMINGTSSTWSNTSNLDVGYSGSGTLSIANGGSVSNSSGYIAYNSGSTGMVIVNGVGSTWTNSSSIYVGSLGKGTLKVSNGGVVTAKSASINSQSLLAIDVGNGSRLTVNNGSGTLTNNGKVRLSAGSGAATGGYQPILAGTWSGTGTCQALGGVWNSSSHLFTVSDLVTGTAGTPVAITNLVDTQRMLISDDGEDGTGWTVGAGFAATTTPTSLTLTATVMTEDVVAALQNLLNPNQSVLSAWDFESGAGYTQGDPVYLSFGIGANQLSDSLRIWHHDANGWTSYAASDLTYDGTYASFTATGFSGYAVTVPEPSSLTLLATGLFGLLAYVWRKRK